MSDINSLLSFTGKSSNRWNYSNEEGDNYFPNGIMGDLIKISFPQARQYSNGKGTGALKYWKDGNPVLNVAFTIRCKLTNPDGSTETRDLVWEFSGGQNASRAAVAAAVEQAINEGKIKEAKDMSALCPGNGKGYNISIITQPGVYNQANPRPWAVIVNGDAEDPQAIEGVEKPTAQPQGQVQQAQPQQPVQPAQAPTMQQPTMQQPTMQQPQAKNSVAQAPNAAVVAAQKAAAAAGVQLPNNVVAANNVDNANNDNYLSEDIPF